MGSSTRARDRNTAQFPHLLAYSDVRDVGKAAKDRPQLNFISSR